MSKTTLPCPAKLNLFLEVRGKRADGYHELGTLFQAVEFGDVLTAEPADRIEVICDTDFPGPVEDNLVYKAAALLKTRYADRVKPEQGIRFSLEKRIPTGAGLGGGSSDAAAALRLANEIWGLDLSVEELRALAPELGADVAFFLFEPTAFAEGRGEILTAAPEPFPFYVVIATPRCYVETAWAYRQLQHHEFGKNWEGFKSRYASRSGDSSFFSELRNDFEAPITAHFEEIREIHRILDCFLSEKTLLTGSGASLFALFKNREDARNCLLGAAPYCRFSALTRFKTSQFF